MKEIYRRLRDERAAFMARHRLAVLGGDDGSELLASLLRQGYLIEAHAVLTLSARGFEVGVGLARE